MDDCIFCRIAGGKIRSDIVYQDEKVVAFKDIDPKAPVHIIVIPRMHVDKMEDVEDHSVFAEIFRAIKKVIRDAKYNKVARIITSKGLGTGEWGLGDRPKIAVI